MIGDELERQRLLALEKEKDWPIAGALQPKGQYMNRTNDTVRLIHERRDCLCEITEYKFVYEGLIKKVPDYYQAFPDSELFTVPFNISAFQGQQGKIELELSYAIPKAVISLDIINENYHLKQGIFFYHFI